MNVYIVLICFFLFVGVVGTVAVGMSKENREGNPEYDLKTKTYWTRLTWYYVIAGILGVLAVILFIQFR